MTMSTSIETPDAVITRTEQGRVKSGPYWATEAAGEVEVLSQRGSWVRAWVAELQVRVARGDVHWVAEALNYEDWHVRMMGIWGLGQIGNLEALERLVRCLRDHDERVRREAKKTLQTTYWRLT